jgi:hypothetical protein
LLLLLQLTQLFVLEHLVSVAHDPFLDAPHINILLLHPLVVSVDLLLLIALCLLLESTQLFLLPLHKYILPHILSLKLLYLSVLLLVSLLHLDELHASVILPLPVGLTLFLDPLHQANLLGLHFLNLILQSLDLHFLLVCLLHHSSLLLVFLLQVFQLIIQVLHLLLVPFLNFVLLLGIICFLKVLTPFSL